MSKKIVLKVDITAERCKAGAMSVVAKLPGIKSMAVDGEKGTLTVVGDVDVVEEKKPEPAKKPDEPKKSETPKPAPPCCCSGPGNACCPRPMPPYPGAAIVCYEEEPDGHCIIV
ncbi:hypothetical protein TRIUR3_32035 [Triticum urartu]|uniref:HMA domain-containing protein n=2 Tax=Triticum TaxID=4564 RepID=A0A9R0SNH5_TRITD|nr:hypothetical protein TRIUR3_32035 [Triticum urartu]VAH97990.1 unnamed protein product [Triticum turgidum subsp. durum]